MAFASVRACILIYFFLIFLLVLPCTLYNLEAMVLGLINGTWISPSFSWLKPRVWQGLSSALGC
jgi:hypothetical protein